MFDFSKRALGTRSIVPRVVIFSALAVLGAVPSAFALPTQFASFLETDTNGFVWTNKVGNSGATFNTSNTTAGIPVLFQFQNLSGVPTGLQAAHLTLTSSTNHDGANLNGVANQPISGDLTLAITRDSDQKKLLSATVTPAANLAVLSGQNGSASLNTSTPNENITFTSDFVKFSGTALNALGLTLGGLNPGLSFNTAGNRSFLNSFVATGNGSFSSDVVPEPTSMALMGIGCVILAGAHRRLAGKSA